MSNSFISNHGLNESTFENKTYLEENRHIDIKYSKYCNVNYFINAFERGLSVLSLNMQSMSSKFDEFSVFINAVCQTVNVKVICLQETWISEYDSTAPYQLPTHSLLFSSKACCGHGGLITFKHYSFKYNVISSNNKLGMFIGRGI